MATVIHFLPTVEKFHTVLAAKIRLMEKLERQKCLAARTIQRFARGLLIRNYMKMINRAATLIQAAWRGRSARIQFQVIRREYCRELCRKYYEDMAKRIQSTWHGYITRKEVFHYTLYRKWLSRVADANSKRLCEARECAELSRRHIIQLQEIQAEQLVAYVVLKLHHTLRTIVTEGIYSIHGSNALSEFEKALSSVRYAEYSRKLQRNYQRFVRKNKPTNGSHNGVLLPCIGNGDEYWYLSLPDLYQLSLPVSKDMNEKGDHCECDKNKTPFVWKKYTPEPQKFLNHGAYETERNSNAFACYCRHYKPSKEIHKYIDFHINLFVKRKCSIMNLEK